MEFCVIYKAKGNKEIIEELTLRGNASGQLRLPFTLSRAYEVKK